MSNRPTPCHWYDDPDGGRHLIPGCAARAQDPDGPACTCPALADRLEAALAELARIRTELTDSATWRAHIIGAVHAHPDGLAIMRDAADRADAHHARTRQTRSPQ